MIADCLVRAERLLDDVLDQQSLTKGYRSGRFMTDAECLETLLFGNVWTELLARGEKVAN